MTIPSQISQASVDGTGPDLVLIHGMGLNREMWQWLLPSLTPHFRVIRYDLLGHGTAEDPPRNCTLLDLVGQLDRILDELEIESAAVAGFSLGGTLAQAFAVERPNRTSAISVLNSAYRRDAGQRAAMLERLEISERSGPAGTVDAAIERWFTPAFRQRGAEVTDLVRKWMLANDAGNYATLYRVLVEGDEAPMSDGRKLADAIADIACPALIVTGAADANSIPEMSEAMARSIPNGQCAVIPALRHMGLGEDADAFAAVLVPFLKSALDGT